MTKDKLINENNKLKEDIKGLQEELSQMIIKRNTLEEDSKKQLEQITNLNNTLTIRTHERNEKIIEVNILQKTILKGLSYEEKE